ncbi:MAG TPA: TolC family protein [Chthoniobacterales bacterium]|jgi:outer membrane protein TolC
MKSFLILLLGVVSIHAASFTPETAAVHALRHNPDLVAARFAIQEAEGRLIQAGLWKNPEFETMAEFNPSRMDADRRLEIGLLQKFPLAGRLASARAVARVDVAMAIAEFRNQERLLAGRVLEQARAVLLLDRRIAVHTNQMTLLERIQEQTTALASTGRGEINSIGVVQLEKTTVALQRQAQVVARSAALDTLRGLIGFDPETALAITGALPKTPKSFQVDPLRPDLQLALLEADRSRAEQLLARVEKWEDLTVGLGLSQEREDGRSETMTQLRVSIPLPLWDRNQGRQAETRAATERRLALVAARKLAIATEIQEAQTKIVGLAEILRQLRSTAQTQAKQNTERIEQSVASGEGSFLTIYESRRQHLDLALSAVETEMQLASALTEWEMRTGHFPAAVRAALQD